VWLAIVVVAINKTIAMQKVIEKSAVTI